MATVVYQNNAKYLRNHRYKDLVRIIRIERGPDCAGGELSLFTSADTLVGCSLYTPTFISRLHFTADRSDTIGLLIPRLPLIEKLKITISSRFEGPSTRLFDAIEDSKTLRSVTINTTPECSHIGESVLEVVSKNALITRIGMSMVYFDESIVTQLAHIKQLRIKGWPPAYRHDPRDEYILSLASLGALEKLRMPSTPMDNLLKLIALPNLRYLHLHGQPNGYRDRKNEIGQHINNGGIIVLRVGEDIHESLRSIGVNTHAPIFTYRHMSITDMRVVCC